METFAGYLSHPMITDVMLLEHGCEQGAAVRERLRRAGLGEVVTWRDAAGLERVSGGQWSELW